MSDEYIEMGVPFVRLHDTDYPYPQQIDLPQIFRNPDADPRTRHPTPFVYTTVYIGSVKELKLNRTTRIPFSPLRAESARALL